MKHLECWIWIGLAGCGVGGDDHGRIAVGEHNDLGVATLETTRLDDNGARTFTLRAFSSDEQPLGFVRLTTGTIADLEKWTHGSGNSGSEIVVSFGDTESRLVTREVQRFDLRAVSLPPGLDAFVALDSVATTLEREANLLVPTPPSREATFSGNWSAQGCFAGLMNASPLAAQCCESIYTPSNWIHTWHVNPDQSVVYRVFNHPSVTPCTASDGYSSCAGSACYYGPNGSARPMVETPSAQYPYGQVYDDTEPYINACYAMFYDSPPEHYWPDVTGTFPNGQGCPGGASGDGEWDY